MNDNKLLLDEPPMLILPSLAVAIGLEEAVVLQQIHYWVQKAETVSDGRKWVYNTVSEWQKKFPFWSQRTIGRILKRLRDDGLIEARELSKDRHNRTLFYAIDYAKLSDTSNAKRKLDYANVADSDYANVADSDYANVADSINVTETTHRLPTETTSFIAHGAPATEEAPSPTRKGSRLPTDWTPSPEMIEWAKEKAPGVDVLQTTDNFVDYWHSAAGAKASKVDWSAAWRVWIRNEIQRTPTHRRTSQFTSKPTPRERVEAVTAAHGKILADELAELGFARRTN